VLHDSDCCMRARVEGTVASKGKVVVVMGACRGVGPHEWPCPDRGRRVEQVPGGAAERRRRRLRPTLRVSLPLGGRRRAGTNAAAWTACWSRGWWRCGDSSPTGSREPSACRRWTCSYFRMDPAASNIPTNTTRKF
jgi:hypothetical protein